MKPLHGWDKIEIFLWNRQADSNHAWWLTPGMAASCGHLVASLDAILKCLERGEP